MLIATGVTIWLPGPVARDSSLTYYPLFSELQKIGWLPGLVTIANELVFRAADCVSEFHVHKCLATDCLFSLTYTMISVIF